MHKLRVWMMLRCSDRAGWIYLDVLVPVVPRTMAGGDLCDFDLTGLFHGPLYPRSPSYLGLYVDGQPEEKLSELCYDVNAQSWHAHVSDHKVTCRWERALEGPYRNWVIAPPRGKHTGFEPILETKSDVSKIINYTPVVGEKSSPATFGQDVDTGRSIVREAARNIRNRGITRFYHSLTRPEAVRYLADLAARHTDPTAPVIGLIQDSGLIVKGIETKLGNILKHFIDFPRWNSDPVLRVGDLAGKTSQDLEEIVGVGPLAIASLVAAGLIPVK